jgi:F0F1-type ATP synthase membrane subunit c/vacuolar-type H+-ATPase subunit K
LEEVLARIFQFSIALIGAFTVALWFALVVWTYRDAVSRSRNSIMQVFSTLIVVLFFIPGVVIYLLLRPRETLDEKQQRWIEEEYLAQELDDISVCPSCSHAVRDEWIYCPECRFQLRRPCPSCGRLVESSWDICAFCGVELKGARTHEPHYRILDTVQGRPISSAGSLHASSGDEDEDNALHTSADGSPTVTDSDVMNSNGSAAADDANETGELPAPSDYPEAEIGPTRRDV